MLVEVSSQKFSYPKDMQPTAYMLAELKRKTLIAAAEKMIECGEWTFSLSTESESGHQNIVAHVKKVENV